MDRREFIETSTKAGAALLLAPYVIGCNNKVEPRKKSGKDLLTDFLKSSDNQYLTKSGIEKTLYDVSKIYDEGDMITSGRATHLGNNYFLTAYHIVNEGADNLRLIPQWRRGYLLNFQQKFEVVEYDKESDLALLKTSGIEETEKAMLHLDSITPSLDDTVSAFIILSGTPLDKKYEFDYGGVDFYDKSIKIDNLGKLILPAKSLLFEKQGKVLEYDEDYLKKISGNHNSSSENEVFSSILSYNGESGEPVFVKIGDDKYIFAGIVTAGYSLNNIILTPNHPLNYESIQQTGAFFSHKKPIEGLIKKYLEEISQKNQ